MKKCLILLVIVALIATSAMASAAVANSFSDVPKAHWAYGAVNSLVKDGVIEGYGDGTFNGDKTITRYEFAILITKALDKYQTASVAQKAIIDKLSSEFATELNALGTRVTKLEDKVGTFKINGDVRYRYEWVDNPANYTSWPGGAGVRGVTGTSSYNATTQPKVEDRIRFRLFFNNQITSQLSVISDFCMSGVSSGSMPTSSTYTGAYAANPANITGNVEWTYLKYVTDNNTVWKMGRLALTLGQTIWDVPHMDGGQVEFGNPVLRTSLGYGGFLSKDWVFGESVYKVSNTFKLELAHINDKYRSWYNSTSLGGTYTGLHNFTLIGEAGQNINGLGSNGTTPKSQLETIKYLGAVKENVGTGGIWVSHKRADRGFDPEFTANTTLWDCPGPYPGGLAEDLHGYEYGADYTFLKNTVLTFRYDALRSIDNSRDLHYIIAQVVSKF